MGEYSDALRAQTSTSGSTRIDALVEKSAIEQTGQLGMLFDGLERVCQDLRHLRDRLGGLSDQLGLPHTREEISLNASGAKDVPAGVMPKLWEALEEMKCQCNNIADEVDRLEQLA